MIFPSQNYFQQFWHLGIINFLYACVTAMCPAVEVIGPPHNWCPQVGGGRCAADMQAP